MNNNNYIHNIDFKNKNHLIVTCMNINEIDDTFKFYYDFKYISYIEKGLHPIKQKEILPLLIEKEPDTKFIVSTLSPFVIGSIDDAVVYNMDTHEIRYDLHYFDNNYILLKFMGVNNFTPYNMQKYIDRYIALTNLSNMNDYELNELQTLNIYLSYIAMYDKRIADLIKKWNENFEEMSNEF